MSQYQPIQISNDLESRLYDIQLKYFTGVLTLQQSRIDVSKTMLSVMKSQLASIPLIMVHDIPGALAAHGSSESNLRTLITAENANHAYETARFLQLQKIVDKQIARLIAVDKEPGRLTAHRFLELSKECVEVRKVITKLVIEENPREGFLEKAWEEFTLLEGAEGQLRNLLIGGKCPGKEPVSEDISISCSEGDSCGGDVEFAD